MCIYVELLPGRKVVGYPAGQAPDPTIPVTAQALTLLGNATELCPYGFYYDGADAYFGCKKCPLGTTTQRNGSTSMDDCSKSLQRCIHRPSACQAKTLLCAEQCKNLQFKQHVHTVHGSSSWLPLCGSKVMFRA